MFIWIHFQQIIFILSKIETTSCVCVYCHQFLYSNKHIFLVIVMNIFSFLLYFWKEKYYIIYCINKTTNYIVSWLFTKKHHARYVCQSVLYNGESRNSNYDDLLWVHGPRVGNSSWQRAGGTSSKNRLESPLMHMCTIASMVLLHLYNCVLLNLWTYALLQLITCILLHVFTYA